MDSEDASEATEVTTARGRRREEGRGRLAREMIVPEKKMMLPPPSVRVRRRISSERAGRPSGLACQCRVLGGSSE